RFVGDRSTRRGLHALARNPARNIRASARGPASSVVRTPNWPIIGDDHGTGLRHRRLLQIQFLQGDRTPRRRGRRAGRHDQKHRWRNNRAREGIASGAALYRCKREAFGPEQDQREHDSQGPWPAENWPGAQIVLVAKSVEFGGEPTLGTRVKVPQKKPTTSVADDPDDEIPF